MEMDVTNRFSELKAQIDAFRRSLESYVRREPTVNIKNLTGSFRIMDSVPAARNLPEGGIILVNDGVNIRLYVNINGSLRYATLT
jgi:hypothetical protein